MKKLFSLLLMLFTFLPSCQKNEEKPAVSTPTTNPNTLTVYDNVVVVDSTLHHLDQTPALLSVGTYRFTSSGKTLAATSGTIIVGEQGRGFLRRVTAVTTNGNQTTLQTQQASLDELFSGGTLTIRSSSDSLRQHRTAGFSYTFNSTPIYQNGPLSMSLTSGTIGLNPNWTIEAGFGPNGTLSAKVATQNATLDGNFVFNVTATQAATLVARTDTLNKNKKPYYKDFTAYVPVVILGLPVRVPITVRMNLYLLLQYSATINSAITQDATLSSSTTFDVGAAFANSQWQGIYKATPTNTLTLSPLSGNASANVKLALIPKINFQLYDVAGPYASVGLQEELQGAVASPSLDWNFQADAWLHTTVGVTGKIFGKQLPDYANSWDTDKLTYKSPDHLERTAGDNQAGNANQTLPIPIKVRVLDSKGASQRNVPVYFTATSGSGTAVPASILSDANGFAESRWTLGASATTIQHLGVTAKTAAGKDIANAPLDFAATIGTVCLPATAAPMQILTGGSTKTWRTIDIRGFGQLPSLSDLCPSISGNSPTYTFSTNNNANIQTIQLISVNNACSWQAGQGLVAPYCMPSATSLKIRAYVPNGGGAQSDILFSIEELTASSLKLKYSVSAQDYQIFILTP